MTRPLLCLAGLVVLLAAWNALLAAREERARESSNRVGALFSPEEAERLRKQPALRVELAGEAHAYGRVQGQWRCLSYRQAPADARAIQGLIDGLVRAEGLVHSREVAEAPLYGINAPGTIRVSLQGPRATQDPGGDVLATIEIGKNQPGRDSCFVRKQGTREIWAISGDLRAPLLARASGLPPLLEPAAVPAAWLEQGGAAEIEVRRGDEHFTLARRDRTFDPASAQPGDLPWTWILDPGASEQELPPSVAAAYADFVERLPYVDVLDEARRAESGLAPPHATVALRPLEGAPLVLAFGAPDSAGRVPLWVEATRALYLVDARVFELAAPTRSLLARAEEDEHPWSDARRAAPSEPR